MKRQMKKLIVSAVALSLVIPALSAPKAEAAKKPSLVKKVSVKAVSYTHLDVYKRQGFRFTMTSLRCVPKENLKEKSH